MPCSHVIFMLINISIVQNKRIDDGGSFISVFSSERVIYNAGA